MFDQHDIHEYRSEQLEWGVAHYGPDTSGTDGSWERVQFGDGSWGLFDKKTGQYTTLNGAPMNPSALGFAPPPAGQDTSAQVDGAGVPYIVRNGRGYDLNGQPYNPVALPVNQHPGSSYSSSNSTSQSFQDPRALALDAQRIENERVNAESMRKQAEVNGDRSAAQYWQTRLDTLSENAAGRQFTSGENAANRASNAAEGAAQRGFNANESALSRDFNANESALTRAQRAGEFAANYGLQRAQAERQQLADRMQAAETYSRLSGSADLTGYDRFQQAGGGVLGNSIAAGATSLTPEGQLGAARALAAARAPTSPLPDYNPYAAQQPGGVQTYNHLTGGLEDRNTPPTAQMQRDAAKGAALAAAYNTSHQSTPYSEPPPSGQGAQAPTNWMWDSTGASTGNKGIVPVRYALGTMRPPVREPVTAMPTGAGIDTVTDRYAEGTFISGDSTDPLDPAAGGAHPEQITLDDPPGADNARAEVEPLTQPGVGDTDGGGAIGALLIAIGTFLNAQGGGDPVSGPPTPLGSMGGSPRFALGTGIQPEDQPYVDEVMATRLGTKYSINPYAADFQFQSPTRRAIDASAFQTATGVPGSEVAFEADKYAPGGLARNSKYAQELQLQI